MIYKTFSVNNIYNILLKKTNFFLKYIIYGIRTKIYTSSSNKSSCEKTCAGACNGTGDSDCIARTLTKYTSTSLNSWQGPVTIGYTISSNVGATYSVSTSTLTVNFNYTINTINGNTCSYSCPSYPVYEGMQINVILTDGNANGNIYTNNVPLGNEISNSVTSNVAYPNSITIPNLTLSSGLYNWTIAGDDNPAIYNGSDYNYNNNYNNLMIYSNYNNGPNGAAVSFSFTV